MDINSIKFVLKKALLSKKFVIKMASLVILLLLLKRSLISMQDVKEFNTGVENFSARGLLLYMKNDLGKKSSLSESNIAGKPELNPSNNEGASSVQDYYGGNVSATPGHTIQDQFQITSQAAGKVTFGGQGTALFNNSVGTNNSFKVGSMTTLGVTAATSSTPDYAVESSSNLNLATTTSLSHTIGTRSTAEKLFLSAQLDAAYTRATQAAEAAAEIKRDNETSTWESTKGTTWVQKPGIWEDETSYNNAREKMQKKAYDDEYDKIFKTEYASELETISRPDTDTSGTVIKGIFITKESGAVGSAETQSDRESRAAARAEQIVNEHEDYLTDWDTWRLASGWTSGNAHTYSGGETEYNDKRQSFYNQTYEAQLLIENVSSEQEVNSEVIIEGIGSDANVETAADTKFTVKVDRPNSANAATTSTATGSGDAGANLSTTSFANQSSSNNASAFMQSFGSVMSAEELAEAAKAAADAEAAAAGVIAAQNNNENVAGSQWDGNVNGDFEISVTPGAFAYGDLTASSSTPGIDGLGGNSKFTNGDHYSLKTPASQGNVVLYPHDTLPNLMYSYKAEADAEGDDSFIITVSDDVDDQGERRSQDYTISVVIS